MNAKNSAISVAKAFLQEHNILSPKELDKVRRRWEELHSTLQGIPKDMDDLKQTTDVGQLQVLGIDERSKQLPPTGRVKDITEGSLFCLAGKEMIAALVLPLVL